MKAKLTPARCKTSNMIFGIITLLLALVAATYSKFLSSTGISAEGDTKVKTEIGKVVWSA